ncbi:LacI family transcriptional regulator [Bifidobacterium sp. DSM 109958]|uniref:LacI family transcriptional regulator n=1 Tax=Bifidobacterium moraviense TaxID=2675323 RepID=A0A7Y0HYY7_9BIFI|nr:LacI family DNA-binding transcriptional regulator [Bifidobacterium sp. DSM 109958]NMN00877.1 LacI family transcriptional regulator [Bifidobacterium sp. DSM 109958]
MAQGKVSTMPPSSRRSTPVIKDVAQLAGVSVPTVSRYLNGTAKVSAEKREKIAQAIKLLDYKPSFVARALANKEMDSVTLLTSLSNYWATTEVNSGAEHAARDRGFLFGVTSLDGISDDEIESTINRVLSANPAGVIVSESDEIAIQVMRQIPKSVPMVLVGGSRGDAPYQVMPSEREGGRVITEYLLGLGHRNVVHVHRAEGPNNNTRTLGWRDAMKAAGIQAVEAYQIGVDLEESVELGRRLAHEDGVTAVFAGNDETAIALIKGLRDEGARVPDDVSVAGYNDQTFSRMWDPPLTSYSQNFVELGAAAFEMLYAQIEAKRAGEPLPEPECRIIEGRLVVRESTAAPHPRR